MNIMSTTQELHDAILSNSVRLVSTYLEDGADPNQSPALSLEEEPPTCVWSRKIWGKTAQVAISPLHVAVVNCYHQYAAQKVTKSSKSIESAAKIVSVLCDYGAKLSNKACGISVCNAGLTQFLTPSDGITPIELADFFRQRLFTTENPPRCKDACTGYLDGLKSFLQVEDSKSVVDATGRVPVPKTVLKTWKNLLFSEKFSDVTFVCCSDADEEQPPTTLHAHMCVLAAASSYFSAYFEGPWAETHPDGRFETSNSESVMRMILTFIYTGMVDEPRLDAEALGVFSVAREYELLYLISLCEESLMHQLSETNIKDTLQLAHLHGSSKLKQSCFDFVEQNCARVLMNPAMMSLATEDAELWAELGEAIAPDDGNKRCKRERTS